MADIIVTLKSNARRLHREVSSGSAAACRRVGKLRECRGFDDATIASQIKLRQCLAVVAQELGFNGWPHAVHVLSGEHTGDAGTLLYPGRCGGHLNIWCARLTKKPSRFATTMAATYSRIEHSI